MPSRIPDLRERLEDILPLTHTFLQEESRKLRRGQVALTPLALALSGNNISQATRLLEIRHATLHDLKNKHPITAD